MKTKQDPAAAERVHLLTIGTTSSNTPGGDVVDVLIEDLRKLGARRATVLATEDSRTNADRLLRGIGAEPPQGEVVMMPTAQSLDDAYKVASQVIGSLERRGVEPSKIVVHYTAGTKVMSAGMVLAAVNHGCQSLRYLYSPGRGQQSEPVITPPQAVRADGDLRLAKTLMREFRFRSAGDVLEKIDPALFSQVERREYEALRTLAPAYALWDNFRVRGFLNAYRKLGEREEDAGEFRLQKGALKTLKSIARVDATVGQYPVELIFDLFNNAIRRLLERRTDDGLIRLYRAAEVFAQNLLMEKHRIRTDDVDIRRVPPRSRVTFEALRRLDDIKIKIGLRKSYELLALMEDPVGHAFLENTRLQKVLEERRHLVLAHGTKPAPAQVGLDMIEEIERVFELEIPNFRQKADALQFPWILNERALVRLRASHNEERPVLPLQAGPDPEPPAAPGGEPAPAPDKPRRSRRK